MLYRVKRDDTLSGSQWGVLAGAFLSWWALSDPDHGVTPPETMHTRRFLAGMSLGIGLLFALVILMQLAAGLIFGGCEL